MNSRASEGLTRRRMLLMSLAAPLASDQTLLVRRDGDRLRVSAPQIRFLNGRPLEQLRNGASVSFLCQILLTNEAQTILSRSFDQFVVSFDVWDEKFSATRMGPPARSTARLTSPAMEAWCLDQPITIPPNLSPQRRFWLRLELRTEERDNYGVVGDPGISITRLIEVFSRPPSRQQRLWVAGAGPLRLEDVRS